MQTLAKNVPVNALINVPKEMVAQIGKDIGTIGRAIKTLQENGRLRRIGSPKTGYWKLL